MWIIMNFILRKILSNSGQDGRVGGGAGSYGLHGISDKTHALADNPSSRLVFQARTQNCDKRLLASSCLSACPPVHMEQLGSHWTEFHEIWNLCIFRKSVGKIQGCLQSDNNEYFGEDISKFMIMCCSVLHIRTIFHTTFVENIKTYTLCSKFFSENRGVYEIMWGKSWVRQTTNDDPVRHMHLAR